jgi:hypothetical protein
MLDQEAFARVIASNQQHSQPPIVEQPTESHHEEEEDDANDMVDDVTYRPSTVGDEDADPIYLMRLSCLPILDILV